MQGGAKLEAFGLGVQLGVEFPRDRIRAPYRDLCDSIPCEVYHRMPGQMHGSHTHCAGMTVCARHLLHPS